MEGRGVSSVSLPGSRDKSVPDVTGVEFSRNPSSPVGTTSSFRQCWKHGIGGSFNGVGVLSSMVGCLMGSTGKPGGVSLAWYFPGWVTTPLG